MIILLALFLVDRLIKAHQKVCLVVYVILSGILLVNLVVLTAHISILDQQMAPLGKILTGINSGLKDGRIIPERKIYLDDSIADTLPALCWNGVMAKFMEGTYQWIFSPRDQKAFTFDKNQATWVIDEKDLSLTPVSIKRGLN